MRQAIRMVHRFPLAGEREVAGQLNGQLRRAESPRNYEPKSSRRPDLINRFHVSTALSGPPSSQWCSHGACSARPVVPRWPLLPATLPRAAGEWCVVRRDGGVNFVLLVTFQRPESGPSTLDLASPLYPGTVSLGTATGYRACTHSHRPCLSPPCWR